MYDQEMLEAINDGVDLLEYVSDSIEMSKKGDNYFGSCPLHVDLTPSFAIEPKINRFHCFSCGAGGGIIQYLRTYEHLSFDKAVEKASQLAEIDLSKMCQSETVRLNRQLQKNNQKKGKTDHPLLEESLFFRYRKGEINEWLDEGIRQDEIDLFDVRIDDRGNRIVYPVRNIDGKLINVKGRTRFQDYKSMGIPKYINYYKVGTIDYFQCLDITLPFVRESGEIKIFESIKSVMKLMAHGICDSASAEKHTLTVEQISLLVQLKVDVVFCYDSDVSYHEKEVSRNINWLKRFTNVFIIEDKDNLLGGIEGKNSPIDLGIDIWNQLYANRKRIT